MIILNRRIIMSMVIPITMLFFSCKNDLDKVRVDLGDNVPLAITKDFVSVLSDSGVVILQIDAPVRKDYAGEEPYSEMPEGINVTFYDNRKKVIAKLTADYAMIKSGWMFVKGNVEMNNKENGRLTTKSLFWNSEEKMVRTSDNIEIRQTNRILYGQGLTAKQDFSEYHIEVPTGSISISDTD